MAKKQFVCELNWSVSRAKEFARCKREAWFARYASWGWWDEKPPGARWRAMVHKNLTSLAAFTGQCVHEAIAEWFAEKRRGRTLDAAQLFERARARFRDGWRTSSSGAWRERPNKSVHLEEHHYSVTLPPRRTEESRALLERASRAFVESEELASVRESDPREWLAIEALDSWTFDGATVFSVPDFARREGERVAIYDWKTGRERGEDRFQLATYALYAGEKWKVEPESIDLYVAYLGEPRVERVALDRASLDDARGELRSSLEAMRAAHYDPDAEVADLARFPPDGAPGECLRCRFRGMCDAAAGGR
jgi:CRISPR/Cas system-associated exonuclease Cas4 (RecB family)